MIIALGHYSRVGKDETANLLCGLAAAQGVRFGRISFADPLKSYCHQLYGRYGLGDRSYYEANPALRDVLIPECAGLTPVQVWVKVGNEMRDVNENVWVDPALEQAKLFNRDSIVAIPDLRYPNEVRRVREEGGLLVKVLRPGVEPRDTVADQALVNFHDWDYILNNDGTIADLHRKVAEMLEFFQNG